MATINTEEFGIVHEHLVGDMPVFGRLAMELAASEDSEPVTTAQHQELEAHAAMLSGKVIVHKTLQTAAA